MTSGGPLNRNPLVYLACCVSDGKRRFLLEMPTEYVEVSPDAIGRTLNDYPGFAGTHRLAFHGEHLEKAHSPIIDCRVADSDSSDVC